MSEDKSMISSEPDEVFADDKHHLRQNLNLVAQGIRNGWPINPEILEKTLNAVSKIAFGSEEKTRNRLAAQKLIKDMFGQQLQLLALLDKIDNPDKDGVNIQINNQVVSNGSTESILAQARAGGYEDELRELAREHAIAGFEPTGDSEAE